MGGRDVPAEKPATGIGPVRVNAATAVMEEFAAVLDVQHAGAREGEVEPRCAELPEPFVFTPGKFHPVEGAAACAVAFPATAVIIDRLIHDHAVLFQLRAADEHSVHAFRQPAGGADSGPVRRQLPAKAPLPSRVQLPGIVAASLRKRKGGMPVSGPPS